MISRISLGVLSDLDRLCVHTLIDVRSPQEFGEDHLPGAINLPVLSDSERAEIGTIYKQESPFRARKLGAALIARNAARHLEGPLADKAHAWRPFVYCWRGGQRSGGFATILAEIGWRVTVLDGGYKAYRRLVVDFTKAEPFGHRLVLIDGDTGSAKTELLALLAARGHQVVDLEALAGHRGSVFGAMAGAQPSQKAFEGGVANAFARLDPDRPVLVEAESAKIGGRHVPPALWAAMQGAPRLLVDAPETERARYLTRAYGDILADRESFRDRLVGLTPIQGKERIAAWLDLLDRDALETLAADLIRHHYDPRYRKARAARFAEVQTTVRLDDLGVEGLRSAVPGIEDALADLDRRR